jgi:ethanolamine kinase
VLQLLKIINRKAGLTEEQIDNDAVLMRAYGNGTEILIDRESTNTRGICFAPEASKPLILPLLPLEALGALCAFTAECDIC